MSISRWVEEIITDVPNESRRVLIGLGHIMDSVAEGHSEAAERGLRQALWAVQKILGIASPSRQMTTSSGFGTQCHPNPTG